MSFQQISIHFIRVLGARDSQWLSHVIVHLLRLLLVLVHSVLLGVWAELKRVESSPIALPMDLGTNLSIKYALHLEDQACCHGRGKAGRHVADPRGVSQKIELSWIAGSGKFFTLIKKVYNVFLPGSATTWRASTLLFSLPLSSSFSLSLSHSVT